MATFFAVRHKISDHSCQTGGTCHKSNATIEDKLESNQQEGTISVEIASADITPEEKMDSVGHRLHHHHQHSHSHALDGW